MPAREKNNGRSNGKKAPRLIWTETCSKTASKLQEKQNNSNKNVFKCVTEGKGVIDN